MDIVSPPFSSAETQAILISLDRNTSGFHSKFHIYSSWLVKRARHHKLGICDCNTLSETSVFGFPPPPHNYAAKKGYPHRIIHARFRERRSGESLSKKQHKLKWDAKSRCQMFRQKWDRMLIFWRQNFSLWNHSSSSSAMVPRRGEGWRGVGWGP